MHPLAAPFLFLILLGQAAVSVAAPAAAPAPPHLAPKGTIRQLIVDDKPFLILGGELGNSTVSDPDALRPHWADFERLHLNTILAPVSWELVEPAEGRFDWTSVDNLLGQARGAGKHLVLLWFGSWKNSMSSYVPGWVKRDQARFPRTQQADAKGSEILSPLAGASQAADGRAFAAMMAHLKVVDGAAQTVIMVQVENEMGMLPTARDRSPAADAAFADPVPRTLIDHLVRHRATLVPELKAVWEANGARTSGDWRTIFGAGPGGEEVFTAWCFARYADAVARAGKAAYDLPLYVNVALNRPGKAPGEYPSGGPLPHLIDVWKAGAPAIDLIAPDIYFPNFGEIIARYARPDNPLFIPEANQAGRAESGSEAMLALGRDEAFGFSPFSIENATGPGAAALGAAYDLLDELAPLILGARGEGRMTGFRPKVSYDGVVDDAPQTEALGGYRITASFVDTWAPAAGQQTGTHGALVIQLAPDDYLVAGSGVTFTFAPATPGPPQAGLESVEEGHYVDGAWKPGRRLNGDQTHQGRFVRLPSGSWGIQRVRLYRYR
jgi:beta-galactosidase GanA